MAFSEIDIRRIKNSVGELCRRHTPEHLKDQLKFTYELDNNSVSVYEVRPAWDNPKEETKMGVAKFRYIRSRNLWKLYWMRRDLKWHLYDPENMPTSLEALVQVVEQDKHGAFFG